MSIKTQLILAFSLFTATSQLMAAEQNKSCLDTNHAQEVIKFYSWLPVTEVQKFDPCNSESLFTKTIGALIDIENLPILDSRTDEFNQNTYGRSPIQYIKDRVSRFMLDEDSSIGCKDNGTLAYVFRGQNVVHICPASNKISKLYLMEVLIHETRHIDGNGHSLCVRGPFKNEEAYACDRSYEQRGSYGVGTEFKIQISRTKTIDFPTRAEARASAVSDFLVRFNSLPLELKDGVFAQSKDQKLYFASDKIIPISDKTPNGILTSRQGMPTWYDTSKANVFSFDLINNYVETGGTFAVDYRTNWSPVLANSLVDVMYGNHSCKLFVRSMECMHSTKEVAKFTFPSNAKGFLYFRNLVMLKMEDNSVYILPDTFEKLIVSKVEQWQKQNTPLHYSSLVTYSETEGYAVDTNGVLKFLSMKNGRNTFETLTEKDTFTKVIGPTIWSPKLKGI